MYRTNNELADLIVKGRTMVRENHGTVLRPNSDGTYDGCALGMGLAALIGSPERAYLKMLVKRRWFDLMGNGYCSRTLGISRSTARWISWKHCDMVPALTIAYMLRQRPDKPSRGHRIRTWFGNKFMGAKKQVATQSPETAPAS